MRRRKEGAYDDARRSRPTPGASLTSDHHPLSALPYGLRLASHYMRCKSLVLAVGIYIYPQG